MAFPWRLATGSQVSPPLRVVRPVFPWAGACFITLDAVTSTYRGRLAPSPTGLLHVGHARTFWTAYRRAVEAGGTLVFRNEDLDPQRSRPDLAQAMMEDLRWLGIRWQEGPDVGGPFAPYSQQQRTKLYLAAWRKLLERGAIYPCICSRRELAQAAQAPHEEGGPGEEPVYPGTCRNRPARLQLPGPTAEPLSPDGTNWRFRITDGEEIAFDDGAQGRQVFTAGRDFGDFLVWRRDGVPAYQLAVVVDDAAMRITEVVRGADLLLSTARQILLLRALGLPEPRWYHCDLVTDNHGQRLAKRHDALALRALRERGLTPMAVLSAAFSRGSET